MPLIGGIVSSCPTVGPFGVQVSNLQLLFGGVKKIEHFLNGALFSRK